MFLKTRGGGGGWVLGLVVWCIVMLGAGWPVPVSGDLGSLNTAASAHPALEYTTLLQFYNGTLIRVPRHHGGQGLPGGEQPPVWPQPCRVPVPAAGRPLAV